MKRTIIVLMAMAAPLLFLSQEAFSQDALPQEPVVDEQALSSDSLMVEDESSDSDLSSDSTNVGWNDQRFVVRDTIPCDSMYHGIWDYTRVNPYRISIDSLPDSFMVDCRGFYPPNINVVTSECGERWGRFHAGTDMRLAVGDTIRAAFDGKVRITRSNPAMRKKGYGYFAMIRHHNGLETLYGHLSKVLVETNQVVKAGDVVGLGGNTGRSTGPHLHFEFRYLGNPINPRKILDITDTTMTVKADTYLVEKKASFKEFNDYLHSPIKYYKIRQGDNLGKIAKKYHTTVSRLCKLNKIKSTTILRVGRKIRVS